MTRSLRQRVTEGGLFQGYAYGYPHKMAYRTLDHPVPLAEAWEEEEKHAVFLYAHVPFCEMRCGFCNLFTTTGQNSSAVTRYLDAVEREVAAVAGALGDGVRVARGALGGGTPTFLSLPELDRLFGILTQFASMEGSPISVEMSPETADESKLQWLKQEAGVTRASIGVQSFVEAETRAVGRPQKRQTVTRALQAMRDAGFPIRNVDLIYGVTGQTWETWRESLERAMETEPEELFLYPLYIRPLTGLGRKGREPADDREDLYRRGRDWLLERGFRQISMRLFRAPHHPGDSGVHYCCQEDGMVGVGAGARSYTKALHYSTEWAVGRTGVQAILEDYCGRQSSDFSTARHGCILNDAEQRRRHVIKSILRADGLDLPAYQRRFGSDALDDLPMLQELIDEGAAQQQDGHLRPTQLGLEWSDVIGPWLYSDEVQRSVGEFSMR